MKWLVLLGILIAVSVALTLVLARTPSKPVPAIEITPTANNSVIVRVDETQNKTVDVLPRAVIPTENATLLACRVLEQKLLDELEDTDRVLRKSRRTLDLETERYDNARFSDSPNAAMVESFRITVENAKEVVDDAEAANKTATRKLAKARDECGLPG
jgi:hypothetical protein